MLERRDVEPPLAIVSQRQPLDLYLVTDVRLDTELTHPEQPILQRPERLPARSLDLLLACECRLGGGALGGMVDQPGQFARLLLETADHGDELNVLAGLGTQRGRPRGTRDKRSAQHDTGGDHAWHPHVQRPVFHRNETIYHGVPLAIKACA